MYGRLHHPTTNVQVLAPNDITRARWQILAYFGFLVVHREEVEMLQLTLYTLNGTHTHYSSIHTVLCSYSQLYVNELIYFANNSGILIFLYICTFLPVWM